MMDTQKDIQLFSELYDVHPQAILWLTPIWSKEGCTITDFEFTYCNDEGLSYLNLTREQQRGLRLSVSPTVTDELRNTFLKELIHVYLTGAKSETRIYNPALNKYAHVLRTRLRGGVLSVVQDRTEENRNIKELEEKTRQLQVRDQLLDNLLKYSPVGITITKVIRNKDGNIADGFTVLANDRGYEFAGIPQKAPNKKKIGEVDPAILNSPLFQMAVHTLSTGEPFHTQYYFAPTGRWLEFSVAKMDDDHLINIFTDITSTKEAQIQLEQSTERLRAVFNASLSSMLTLSPIKNEQGEVVDFRFIIVNPSYSVMVGYPLETLQGASISTFFPTYLSNGVFDLYKTAYITGATQRLDVHYNFDGLDVYLDLLATKVGDEVLVTLTDFTPLKKTQFELEKLVDELKRSNASLEEFAHAASHDLKEPIRKVRIFSNRLEISLADRLTEVEKDLFERMQNASIRMTQLVDDLLMYSHLHLTPPEMEEVDLNAKLRLVLSDLEVLVEEKKAVIHLEPLPKLKGYRRQLQQLFQNLISNALKYSKEGEFPQITIAAQLVKGADVPLDIPTEYKDKLYHLIEVRDNGIGFEQKHADKIFEMFKRLHGKGEYKGTGVGLSIARKVVDNHKGYIWAEGELHQGAKFNVLLPA
jgi:signal transduction histidine kinase